MHKIVPHLWYDTQAVEAAEFYATVFPDSKVVSKTMLNGTPSGDCDVVFFEVMGQPFQALSAGPMFKINPSISFMVNFDPSQHANAETLIDEVWNKLVEGGQIRMPIQEYPFSKRYGWVEDKYGVNWQLILTNPEGEERPLVLPSLLFTGDVCGRAREAGDYYTSVFNNSKRGAVAEYGPGHEPEKPENLMFSDFKLEETWFVAMDSSAQHDFAFNEAVSFMVNCKDQEEIDYFWEKLSAVPEAEQCGWCKDQFGVSWQIIPHNLEQMLAEGTEEQKQKVTEAFLQMKKFDVKALEEAYNS